MQHSSNNATLAVSQGRIETLELYTDCACTLILHPQTFIMAVHLIMDTIKTSIA